MLDQGGGGGATSRRPKLARLEEKSRRSKDRLQEAWNGAEHQEGTSRSWHPKETSEGSEDKRMGEKRSRLTDVRKAEGVTRAEALGVACSSFPPM